MRYSIDPTLEPLMGPDATITLVGTLGMGWLILRLVWFWVGKQAGSSRTSSYSSGALQKEKDDDDDDNYEEDPHADQVTLPSLPVGMYHDGTLVLCGPRAAGKTSLLDTLLHFDRVPTTTTTTTRATVSSIQPTVGLLSLASTTTTTTATAPRCTHWRCIDLPGHWSPSKVVTNTIRELSRSADNLIVIALVLDATQPVSKAVDYLYEWLLATVLQQQQQKQKYRMVVVAHKSESPKAKNIRRLKLQVKQELERLHSLNHGAGGRTSTVVHWDPILKDQVDFVSTTCFLLMLEEGSTTINTTTGSSTSTGTGVHAFQTYLNAAAMAR